MERALATREEKEYIEKIMPELIDHCRWGDPTWGFTPPDFWVIYFNKKFSITRFITALQIR
jgi:hypothetical protein